MFILWSNGAIHHNCPLFLQAKTTAPKLIKSKWHATACASDRTTAGRTCHAGSNFVQLSPCRTRSDSVD
eukprot:5113502-Karenia_brevis.AAC.1